MHLYLLRHANADTVAASDRERPLSEKGIAQAHKVAAFCEAKEIAPDVILSSPLPRAAQTAAIVAERLRMTWETEGWLACGMDPEVALTELRARREHEAVLLAGHEPDFSRLIAHLLGLPSEGRVLVRKASLTLLEIEHFRPGGACLHFSLPCRLM